MAKIDELVIELKAKTTQLEATLAKTERTLGGFSKSVESQQKKIQSQVQQTGFTIKAQSAIMAGAFAGIGYAALNMAKSIAVGLPMAADKINMLQQRISLFTKDSAEATAVYEKLLSVAIKTGADLEPTVQLYTRLAATLGQAGYKTEEILRITETFSKTLRIQGASTAEAASATLQFAQAMGSGVLRGEELNALMESNSAFTIRLAKALGVPIGELRKLGEKGALTSEILAKALAEMQGEVDKTSEKLGKGLAGEANSAWTAFTGLTDAINDVWGITQKAGAGFAWLATKIKEVTDLVRQHDAERQKDSDYYFDLAKKQEGVTDAQIKKEKELREIRRNPNVSFERPTENLNIGSGVVDNGSSQSAAQMLADQKEKAKAEKEAKKAAKEAAAEAKRDAKEALKNAEDLQKSLNELEKDSGRKAQTKNMTELKKKLMEVDFAAKDLSEQYKRELTPAQLEQIETVKKNVIALDELERQQDSIKKQQEEQKELAKEIGLTFTSAFEDAVSEGAKFSDILKGIEKDIIRILVRQNITKPLLSIFGGDDSNGGGGASNILGSIGTALFGGSSSTYGPTQPGVFGGGRAIGGAVQAGMPYMVGEKRPEIFVPQSAGRIIPNASGMSGGGNGNVTINVVNNSSAKVSASSQRSTSGGISISMMVDEAVAKNMAIPGSRTAQTMQQVNSRTLVRR